MRVKFYGKNYEIEGEGDIEKIYEIVKIKELLDQEQCCNKCNYCCSCRCISHNCCVESQHVGKE